MSEFVGASAPQPLPPALHHSRSFLIKNLLLHFFKVNGESSAERANTVAPTPRQRGVEFYQPSERGILPKSAMRRKATRTRRAAGGGAGVLGSPRTPPAPPTPARSRRAAGARSSRSPAPPSRRLRAGAAPGSALSSRRGVLPRVSGALVLFN